MQDPTGLRRRVAAYLADHGPTWADAVIAALAITDVEWFRTVNNCPWFGWPGDGKAGFWLTDRGRAEGLGPQQGG